MPTKIEYLDESWNPVSMVCTPASEGCKNCWHRAMAHRFKRHSGSPRLKGLDVLNAPLRWRKPRRIGVQFMGDLFHSAVDKRMIDKVMDRVLYDGIGHHTFFLLTKRAGNMSGYFAGLEMGRLPDNVWAGTSIESAKTAWRIEPLMDIVGKRWVSAEPLLGQLPDLQLSLADWVVCGAESGPGARECKIEWVRRLKDECVATNVPFFYKQGPDDNGNRCKMPMLDGQVWAQYPREAMKV